MNDYQRNAPANSITTVAGAYLSKTYLLNVFLLIFSLAFVWVNDKHALGLPLLNIKIVAGLPDNGYVFGDVGSNRYKGHEMQVQNN